MRRWRCAGGPPGGGNGLGGAGDPKRKWLSEDTQISVRRNGESGQDEEFSCGHDDLVVRGREPSRDARHLGLYRSGSGWERQAGVGAYLWAGFAWVEPRERIGSSEPSTDLRILLSKVQVGRMESTRNTKGGQSGRQEENQAQSLGPAGCKNL